MKNRNEPFSRTILNYDGGSGQSYGHFNTADKIINIIPNILPIIILLTAVSIMFLLPSIHHNITYGEVTPF